MPSTRPGGPTRSRGVERFLRSNLTRGRTIPIPVQFLGRTYMTPVESLPWYNTLAWTAFATPVGFLALALVGAGRAALPGPVASRSGVLVALGIGRSCWSCGPCPTRRATTASASSCRPWDAGPGGGARGGLGGGAARPVGKGWSIVAALAEGAVERRPDDAGPALLLQPGRRRPARGDRPGDGADLLLGRPLRRGPRLAQPPHRAGPEGPVRDRSRPRGSTSADRQAPARDSCPGSRAGTPGTSSRTGPAPSSRSTGP